MQPHGRAHIGILAIPCDTADCHGRILPALAVHSIRVHTKMLLNSRACPSRASALTGE